METHYQLLGVNDRADSASIRAAYLALAKRYHPDVAARSGAGGIDLTRINIAYAVLRNPERRAAYDASLLESRKRSMLLAPRQVRLPQRRRSKGKVLGRWLGGTCIGAALLFVLMEADRLNHGANEVAYQTERLATGSASPGPVGRSTRVQIDPRIQDAAAFGTELTLPEAKKASRHCFEQRAIYPSLSIADQCIAFDLAFAAVHPGAGSPYFSHMTMLRRHFDALTVLVGSEDRARRLNAIAEGTNSALLAVATARSEGVLPPVYSAGRFPQ